MKPLTRRAMNALTKVVCGPAAAAVVLTAIPQVHADVSSSPYWTLAQETHNFTVGNLLTPSYSGYRTGVGQGTTTEWYDASQMYADAAMIQYGDSRYLSYLDNTYAFMNNLWANDKSIGGYYAQANIDGSGAGGDQYVDDISGLQQKLQSVLDVLQTEAGRDTNDTSVQTLVRDLQWLLNH